MTRSGVDVPAVRPTTWTPRNQSGRSSSAFATWYDGRPIHPERFSKWFEVRAIRSGLPRIRLHDLRHSYATAALAANVSPKVVSERLGHASVSFTLEVYTHLLPDMQTEAAEAIDRILQHAAAA